VSIKVAAFVCETEDDNDRDERIEHLMAVMEDFVAYTRHLSAIGRDAPRGIKHKIPVWPEYDYLKANRIEECLLGIIELYPTAIDRANRLVKFVETT
jgi:hypothetical protein